jgi:hypothetical protein
MIDSKKGFELITFLHTMPRNYGTYMFDFLKEADDSVRFTFKYYDSDSKGVDDFHLFTISIEKSTKKIEWFMQDGIDISTPKNGDGGEIRLYNPSSFLKPNEAKETTEIYKFTPEFERLFTASCLSLLEKIAFFKNLN